MQSKYTAVGYR